MKACLVTILTLCFAGNDLAAPTQAFSSQLSQRDVAALQDLVRRKPEIALSASEANALLANLISDLGNGQSGTNGNYRRQPVNDVSSGNSKGEAGGPDGDGGKGGLLSTATDTVKGLTGGNGGGGGPLGGLTDGVTGLLGGGGGEKKGGLLGGILIPGILRREEEENPRMLQEAGADAGKTKSRGSDHDKGGSDDDGDDGDKGNNGDNGGLLDSATDTVKGLTDGKDGGGGPLGGLTDGVLGLLGGAGAGDQKKGGLLGGILIPGILKRGEQENSRMLQEAGYYDDDDSDDGGLLGGALIPGILKRREQESSGMLHKAGANTSPNNLSRRDAAAEQKMTAEQLCSMILERLAASRQGTNNKRDSNTGQAMTTQQLRSMILERLAAAQQGAQGHQAKRDSGDLGPNDGQNLGGAVGGLLGDGVGDLVDTLAGLLGLNGGPLLGNLGEVLGQFPENPEGSSSGLTDGQQDPLQGLTNTLDQIGTGAGETAAGAVGGAGDTAAGAVGGAFNSKVSTLAADRAKNSTSMAISSKVPSA